jgi:signal transduction histidine kinase
MKLAAKLSASIQRRLVPQSLRGQFTVALSALGLLILAGGIIAIYALRTSNSATRDLVEESLVHMQDAQDMLQHTLLIERETNRLEAAASLSTLRSSYAGIDEQLGELDRLVTKLTVDDQNAGVLDMYQSGQLFRNTVNIVARLRESSLETESAFTSTLRERVAQLEAVPSRDRIALIMLLYALQGADSRERVQQLRADFLRQASAAQGLPDKVRAAVDLMLAQKPDAIDPNAPDLFTRRLNLLNGKEILQRFDVQLVGQAEALVRSARQQSEHFTSNYRASVGRLVESSNQGQRWVAAILVASLLLAWAVGHVFLGRLVLSRLADISRQLRSGHIDEQAPLARVYPTDEIGDMARAVDQFLMDRHQLEKKTAELNLAKERLAAQNTQLHEEAAIRERTEQELRELVKKLGHAQNQLLQSEKMASIGVLAAGIAHEINNPIGFVNSNLHTLQTYVYDMLKLLAAYEQAEGSLIADALQEINRLKSEIDIRYLRGDIDDLLRESQDGLQRVKRIVLDLKDFSHVDEAERQVANLEQGLDSTLNVVWNELKYKAEVIKEYGSIPEIECFPSQLNQVFMNLLVNAVQAIEEHGRITLRTGVAADDLWIEVEDTGKGIPPEHLGRLFEPFFTTKPVGQGTGLGLSLSYGIVQKHDGRIEVKSEVGKGSVFRVVLPLRQIEDKPVMA